VTTTNESDGLRLVLPGRRVAAGRGAAWVGEGWRLFRKAPLMWCVGTLLLFLASIILSLVPFVGSAAVQVLTPVYIGGLMVACRSLETGGEFEMDQLLAGFRERFGPLAIVGLVFLAGMIVILLVFALAAGFSVIAGFLTGAATPDDWPAALAGSAVSIVIALLISLALWVPLLAAYWFAPALVILNHVAPLEAMKASFGACFRNFVPFLAYGLIMLGLAIVAIVPAIVPVAGWIASVAAFAAIYILNVTAGYAAYREIFTE